MLTGPSRPSAPQTPAPATRPALLVLLVLLVLGLVAPMGPARAAEKDPRRTGFGVVPATADGLDVRALFSFGLTPGSVAFDHVAVVNYSRKPLMLNVYPADALNAAKGGYALRSATDTPADLGSWISIDGRPGVQTVRVTGRRGDGSPGRVILPISVTVPANATPGDHAAGIVASLDTLGKNSKGQNIRLEQRVASRVYVQVDGRLQPDLAVTALSATYVKGDLPWQRGSVRVVYTMSNGGNVRLGYTPSVRVAGPFDLGATTVEGDPVAELLPGSSVTVRTTIPDMWPLGYLHVTVTGEPKAAIAAAVPALKPARESIRIWAISWLLVLLLILGLGYLGHRIYRRRRNQRIDDPGAGPGKPAEATRAPAASRAGR